MNGNRACVSLALYAMLASVGQAQVVSTFDVAGSTVTNPRSINGAGVITGSYDGGVRPNGDTISGGFVRSAAGVITLFDPAGSVSTEPVSINAQGTIAGQFALPTPLPDGDNVQHGFVRSASGAITVFDPPGAIFTSVTGINDSGEITGYYQTQNDPWEHGFIRRADGTFISLQYPPIGQTLQGRSINASGAVAGVADTAGFVRSAAGIYTGLTNPPGYLDVKSINQGGSVAGIYQENGSHGFVRSPGGLVTVIDPAGSISTEVYEINAAGTAVGFFSTTNEDGHGFLRNSGGVFTIFDIPGSLRTIAASVNSAGAVTGGFEDANGFHGFVRTADCQPVATPNVLTPPNNSMIPVTVSIPATASCQTVSNRIVSVSFNEPAGKSADWTITSPLTVNLRASRLGNGTGRVYTILVESMDPAGVATTRTVEVTVPHDRGN